MKTLIFFLVSVMGAAAFAGESRLMLSGTVPLVADVFINKNNQVIQKSSAGLKTRIQKRNFASIVEVSAP